jgi:hypothetical protein
VGIFGPPDTLYEGGYFKADMEFPTTYPFSPPKVNKYYFNQTFPTSTRVLKWPSYSFVQVRVSREIGYV